jgi:hypothetical protein
MTVESQGYTAVEEYLLDNPHREAVWATTVLAHAYGFVDTMAQAISNLCFL